MDSKDLQQFINDHLIEAEIIFLDVHTPTVEAAALALGVHESNIVKSLLFLSETGPVLVIASGPKRVSYKALADYLGISRRKTRLAKADEVLEVTGYLVGTVPPFGHRRSIRTIADAGLMEQENIYAGGGEINALVRLTVDELVNVIAPEVVSL